MIDPRQARRRRARIRAGFYVAGVLAYGWLVRAVGVGLLALPDWMGNAAAVSVVAVLLALWPRT